MILKMLVVQPISFSVETFVKILPKYVSIAALESLCADFSESDEWLKRVLKSKGFKGGFKKIHLELGDFWKAFESDLYDQFPSKIAETLATTIVASPEVKLYFDTRFDYFLLVYELEWHLDAGQLDICFQIFSDNEKDDSYNKFRNIFVQESSDQKLSLWSAAIRSQIRPYLSRIAKQIYAINIYEEEFLFVTNTGNISLFLSSENEADLKRATSSLDEIHNVAEKTAQELTSISLPNQTSHTFGGRFHTITSANEDVYFRYAAIQFHAQFMYCYLRIVNNVFDYAGGTLAVSRNSNPLRDNRKVFEDLIIKIEQLNIYNESFKNEIEMDNERLYQPVQSKWNLENLLTQTRGFIGFFRDYLDILYERDQKRRQNTLNSILSIIAVLQLLTVVSFLLDISRAFPDGSAKVSLLSVDITKPVLLTAGLISVSFVLIVIIFVVRTSIMKILKR